MTYDPKSYFNAMAKQMKARSFRRDVAGKNTAVYRYKRKAFLRLLSKLSVRNRTVLEVGCGPGGNLEFLSARHPARLTGCDISEEMISLASDRLSLMVPEIDLQLVDGRFLPYGDTAFDLVFTVTVLQHNSDDAVWQGLIAEICRVAGEAVVLYEDVAPVDCGWPTYRKRPLQRYAEEMSRHGFRKVDERYVFLYWTERIINRLHRMIYGMEIQEGATEACLFSLLERIVLLPLLMFDRLVRRKDGLVRMSFVRDKEGYAE